jgi:hypothetical protein
MDPRDNLDAVKKRKFSFPCWESKPYSSAISPYPIAIPGELAVYIGGWVAPRVGLEVVAKRTTPAPVRKPTSVFQPELIIIPVTCFCEYGDESPVL